MAINWNDAPEGAMKYSGNHFLKKVNGTIQFYKDNAWHACVWNDEWDMGKLRPTQNKSEVEETITERGNRYGKFSDGAEIMQSLKNVMRESEGWSKLSDSQKEGLEMIQHKIGRVLNGGPNYDDNYRDIAGYATLLLEECNGVKL